MRIGVYSGSFDPVHTGHAIVANYVAQSGLVDEVWMMVSRLNPLKEGKRPSSDAHRLEMVEIVAGKCRNVRASDFELSLPLPSYTYVTLRELKRTYPDHDFVLIVGSDNWLNIHEWRNPDEIIREFGMIIYPRPGYEISGALPRGVRLLRDAPLSLISSTFVRDAAEKGMNLNFFVPCAVADLIKTHSLYEL